MSPVSSSVMCIGAFPVLVSSTKPNRLLSSTKRSTIGSGLKRPIVLTISKRVSIIASGVSKASRVITIAFSKTPADCMLPFRVTTSDVLSPGASVPPVVSIAMVPSVGVFIRML